MLVLMLVSFSCGRAPKPKTETVVEEMIVEDYFSNVSQQQRKDEDSKKENEQKRYDITNAVTVAIIALMLAQY